MYMDHYNVIHYHILVMQPIDIVQIQLSLLMNNQQKILYILLILNNMIHIHLMLLQMQHLNYFLRDILLIHYYDYNYNIHQQVNV